MLNIYLISEGSITQIGNTYGLNEDGIEADGINSVIVAAETEEDASALSAEYKAGKIGVDNLTLKNGLTIVCVSR
jgi:hypothetical protein